ncbi:hypothetical protein [Natronomonas sp. LN261]|uniref:DUF7322 domain-containing protein n=1 Tax=Natronomonas sp. LN261 TaxID=2750669 RepID=UPI0015EFB582|nr:hypothetical protein [Natronomonas sp. LN261]
MNPIEEEEEEAWPDEPDEFEPDSLGPDPPDSTRTLRESLGATEDVSEDLFRAFWASVLLLNVALAALSIGAMLVYFRGNYAGGGPALFIGAVAALATARYYWRFKTGQYADDSPTGSGEKSEDRTGEAGDEAGGNGRSADGGTR